MKYDVTIKTLPERQVASVRQILPGYDREGDLWHLFARETASLRIQDGDPPLCVSIFHDGEFKESDVDVEIQKTVKGTYPDGGLRHLPGRVPPDRRGESGGSSLGRGQRLHL